VNTAAKHIARVMAACLILVSQQGLGCPVCTPLPQQTVADQVIAAEVVAFGRIDPGQPFSFVAVEVLKGQLTDPRVELFADSATRHQLAAVESRFVLLVKSKDGWQSLGVVDAQYQQIVQRILSFVPEWERANGEQKRLEFFLSLWSHENRAIFELAYLELGKAPYAWIRQIGPRFSIDELEPILTRQEYFEWRSLAILLLAQRKDDATQQLINRKFEHCMRYSLTTNLSAWATAYVEVHGANGVKVIEREYLHNETRSKDEIRGVLTALSVHGRQTDADLRANIVAAYGSVLHVHPEAAYLIARDLSDWKTFVYAPEFRKILSRAELKFEPNDRLALTLFVQKSGRDDQTLHQDR